MAFFDLQVNGYGGVDFCSANLTTEEVRTACDALRADGIEQILATVITDTVESIEKKLANLVRIRESDEEIAKVIAGFHVEGPFISPVAGFVGAHPVSAVRPADVDSAKRILDAGEGWVRLMTLAPEWDEGCRTTRFLVDSGVTVSAGHCDPSLEVLREAIDAGLTMVTHLGNGCPVDLPRHDNIIQRCLYLADRLWLCFIPDGVHVPFFALKSYIRQVGVDRVIVTTDAIMAAGLGPGRYELSGFPIEIDERGVARRPGSLNLAGSTVRGFQVAENLANEVGLSAEEIRGCFYEHPRQALGI